jgi:hypothetical protein
VAPVDERTRRVAEQVKVRGVPEVEEVLHAFYVSAIVRRVRRDSRI